VLVLRCGSAGGGLKNKKKNKKKKKNMLMLMICALVGVSYYMLHNPT
jgi:predicted nucleic acid-binding Zn ribbon protein